MTMQDIVVLRAAQWLGTIQPAAVADTTVPGTAAEPAKAEEPTAEEQELDNAASSDPTDYDFRAKD